MPSTEWKLSVLKAFVASLLPDSPAILAHSGIGRERATHFTSSRPRASEKTVQHRKEESIIQPAASSSLSTSSWDSDNSLRTSPKGNIAGFCAQQWPQNPVPKGAAGTSPFRAEWLSCLEADVLELISPLLSVCPEPKQRSF